MTQMTIEQAVELARRQQLAGRPAESEAICRRILAQQPQHAGALNLLGMLACQAGQLPAAVELIRQSILVNPNSAEAHNNLGVALQRLGQADQAVAAHRQAVRLAPQSADAHYNLGIALRSGGQLRQAIDAFKEAIRLTPDFADACNNLGNAHRELGELDEAIAAYREAIRIDSNQAAAHNNLGTVLREVGLLEEAISQHRKAMELRPDATSPHDNLILAMNYHPACEAGLIDAELNRWYERHARPLEKFVHPHTNHRDRERRLRIGYLSGDFRHHACAHFLLPLLRAHDRAHFEITCYSQTVKPDSLTDAFEKIADRWRPSAGLGDAQLADLIREDQIDILVDAMGHTAANRLTALARKPAPVLASWMGYVSAASLPAIDYRITDAHVEPPEIEARRTFELPVRLPDSLWCYDPLSDSPKVNELPALSGEGITFGCLNNFAKINDAVMSTWASILRAVEKSRLLILCPEGSGRRRFLDAMANRGIPRDRLEFASNRARAAYLELYHRVDISLDPFPYNGHTTSLDSWWMGVPVLTLAGKTAVGRIGISHAASLQLTNWVARDVEEYIRLAVAWAEDRPMVAELRRALRARMEASPLMDAQRFARNIEAAYRGMWQTWCSQ